MAQLARYAVEHEPRTIVLARMAVDAQEELNVVRVRDGRFGNGIADGEEGVKAFSDGPGETFSLGFVLGVAGGHVDGEAVAFFLRWGKG